ncbi:MAG TPA: ABC transporter ATP-binding protein [Gemmatimonadaceae bacterium]|nr:ABC transporter ATP-binding protein [Gemmatimonadaceae bacterium]
MTGPPLLQVQDLRTTYVRDTGRVHAVDGVTFDVGAGEIVALVGESGCGKTALALSLMRVLSTNGRLEPGSRIRFDGLDLLSLSERAMCDLRGRRLAMIFQEPLSALNPVMTVGAQVAEVARLHGERSRRVAWDRAIAMLERTGIAAAGRRARQYPHELSGGMRQRVLIAMALLLAPSLVIADEPTSALDVTVQAQILDLLRDLQRETGMAVLFITHDFGVVAELCSRALVMREGKIVEDAPVDRLFRSPAHPYTAELLAVVPRLRAHGPRGATAV